jgi:hypothetical protein
MFDGVDKSIGRGVCTLDRLQQYASSLRFYVQRLARGKRNHLATEEEEFALDRLNDSDITSFQLCVAKYGPPVEGCSKYFEYLLEFGILRTPQQARYKYNQRKYQET